MKKIVITIIAAIAATSLWAQPLCPTQEGVSLTYATKNAKGKVQNYSKQTVTAVEGSGSNFTVTYASEAMDAKKKTLPNVPIISYTYKVENGAVVIDPKAILNSVATASPTDGAAEGSPMILPADMQAGDALPDCEMKMKIAFINVSASYTEGVCEGNETITTEAGTFDCKKTKFRCKSSAMGIKTEMIVHAWYAPEIGLIKQDMYNTKGKLNTTQELIALN
ncbi:MAG: hypothetical protein LBE56_13345 [Tannerella sp.]|jgi:hypothetical protein|nr:hypothetical protein [Tannerella sp.]